MTHRRVFITGVGITKFAKPGTLADYPKMVKEAVEEALADAYLCQDKIEVACVGYVYGDSTCGQRALYDLGMSGIPMYNVSNNCVTGATSLMLAKTHIEAGYDCVLVLGFETMNPKGLRCSFPHMTNPISRHAGVIESTFGLSTEASIPVQIFGHAAREHMKKHGTKVEHFAKIAEKNHRHAMLNPKSQYRGVYTLQDILQSRMIFDPLTKLQCCPLSDGAAAVVMCSEGFLAQHGPASHAVEILGMEMCSDVASTFNGSAVSLMGHDTTKKAADALYARTGISPREVDVVELHDCFSASELIFYEALGLCEEGKGGELVDSNKNLHVNRSGGLLGKGHPLGATGVAQCVELCLQLRGAAGTRQVPGARLALQHNIGLNGGAVVALYSTTSDNQILKPNSKL